MSDIVASEFYIIPHSKTGYIFFSFLKPNILYWFGGYLCIIQILSYESNPGRYGCLDCPAILCWVFSESQKKTIKITADNLFSNLLINYQYFLESLIFLCNLRWFFTYFRTSTLRKIQHFFLDLVNQNNPSVCSS